MWIGLLAVFARIAADWEWLVAVGDHVRRTGGIPDHVPFAAAPSEGWHDVPVLAQLVASVADDLGGTSATVALHLLAVTATLLVLVASVRHLGASDARAAALVAVLCLGALPALALVRLQTFSLVMFALLVSLLWHQAARATKHIWWLPVLVAVWGNLHGAVLLGVCVAGAYLLLGRMRERVAETIAVGAATLLALCATPQGVDTIAYYASVLDNEAAARGEGLWARPDLTHPFDVLMLGAAVVLGVVALRRRRAAWEYVACLGLAAATAEAARHGVWLLVVLFMVAAVPAAGTGPTAMPRERWARRPVAVVAAVSMVLAVMVVGWRGDSVAGVDPAVVEAVVTEAGDDVVLAPAPLVESLAARGVTVWAGNPLDAFTPGAQRAYLDFIAGEPGMEPAVEGSDLVVVVEDSASDRGLSSLDETLERRGLPGGYVAYLRP